jgi:hypothetical protein
MNPVPTTHALMGVPRSKALPLLLKKLAMNRDALRIIASLIVQPQEHYRTLELMLKKHKGRRFRSHILLRGHVKLDSCPSAS